MFEELSEKLIILIAGLPPHERGPFLDDLERLDKILQGIARSTQKIAMAFEKVSSKPQLLDLGTKSVPMCYRCANPCNRFSEKVNFCPDFHEKVEACVSCRFYELDETGSNGACVGGHECVGGNGHVPRDRADGLRV